MAIKQIESNYESLTDKLDRANAEALSAPRAVVPVLTTALAHRTQAEAADSCAQRIDLAIEAVTAILRDPDSRDSDKLAAASFIRDTAHGKPVQAVTVRTNAGSTIDGMYNEVFGKRDVIEHKE